MRSIFYVMLRYYVSLFVGVKARQHLWLFAHVSNLHLKRLHDPSKSYPYPTRMVPQNVITITIITKYDSYINSTPPPPP
jgi:hypothetical protein